MASNGATRADRRRRALQSPSPESEDNTPPAASESNKRRRIGIACSLCRVRKTRCNGARPKCALCEAIGAECVYETADTGSVYALSKSYVVGLSYRIEALEQRLAKYDRLLAGNALPGPRSGHFPDPSPGSILLSQADLQSPANETEETTGMALSYRSERHPGYFGPSSNIPLQRQVEHLVAAIRNSSMSGESGVQQTTGFEDRDGPAVGTERLDQPLTLAEALTLPPEPEMKRLLDTYFEDLGFTFPLIDETHFRETYRTITDTGFKRIERTWLIVLNMIFALAESSHPEENALPGHFHRSYIFYRRAVALCGPEMVGVPSNLETVQYLILMTYYLQGTQKPAQTWATHGLAIQAAFAIGLHSPVEAAQGLSAQERETRKRAWWACVLLDRVLGMMFGRPCSIAKELVRVDLPEARPNNPSHASDTGNIMAVSMAAFRATILLHNVTYNTLTLLYDKNIGCSETSESEMPGRILELETMLATWRQSLPQYLTIKTSTTINTGTRPDVLQHYVERSCVTLTLRYHYLRLLIYRPALAAALASRSIDPGQDLVPSSWSRFQGTFVDDCAHSAQELISILHTLALVQDQGKCLLGPWWHALFYAFTSSLILFAWAMVNTLASPELPSSPKSLSAAAAHITKACELVKCLDGNPTVRKGCHDYLALLRDILETQHAQMDVNTDSNDFLGAEFDPFDPTMMQMPTAFSFELFGPS